MTTAQLVTLKAAIDADPTLSSLAHNDDNAIETARQFNLTAVPNFIVWKTNVDPNEIMKNGMNWTRVDNLSVGKARIWDWLTRLGTFDASKENVRAGIDATWVGTAADLAVRASVYTHCKRPCTKGEKLYATGAGTDASPATLGYEGNIGMQEVMEAWNINS